jgi:hypothetical protein
MKSYKDDPQDVGLTDIGSKKNDKNSVTSLLLGLAALALGQALQKSHGFLTAPGLVWLTIALLCSGASAASQYLSFPKVSGRFLRAVLVTGLAWQIFQLVTTYSYINILPSHIPILWQFQTSMILGGICALISLTPWAWRSSYLRRGLIASTFFAILLAGIWVIRTSPNPFIDVYVYQQTSSEALLNGQNPYELTPPNIYGNIDFYGPELVKDGNMTIGNPYPPLSIYLSFLGYVMAGDIRYSHLAALLMAGLLMTRLRPSREALLAAYIFLFTPSIYFVLEQSWTEPLVLLLSVAVVWCALNRPAWKFAALGLLVASKQYMIFLSPLIVLLIPPAATKRFWVQACGWTVASAFVVTAPLAFWNFPAFLWNVGLAQWYQVFRTDALSYTAFYALAFGQLPSQFLSFIVLGLALLLIWRFGSRTPTGYAIALALCLGLFFAFNKQAFCNYYFLVIGILCCALAAIPMSENDELK